LEVHSIHIVQDSDKWQACSKTLGTLPFPYMSGYVFAIWATGSFWTNTQFHWLGLYHPVTCCSPSA